MKEIQINICMGSSCFARGNSKTIQILEDLVENPPENTRIILEGKLCIGNCSEGPNLAINGTLYHDVHPNCILDILKPLLTEVSL